MIDVMQIIQLLSLVESRKNFKNGVIFLKNYLNGHI